MKNFSYLKNNWDNVIVVVISEETQGLIKKEFTEARYIAENAPKYPYKGDTFHSIDEKNHNNLYKFLKDKTGISGYFKVTEIEKHIIELKPTDSEVGVYSKSNDDILKDYHQLVENSVFTEQLYFEGFPVDCCVKLDIKDALDIALRGQESIPSIYYKACYQVSKYVVNLENKLDTIKKAFEVFKN